MAAHKRTAGGISYHLDMILESITHAVERGDADTEFALTGLLISRVGPKLHERERDELLAALAKGQQASERPGPMIRRRDSERARVTILHTEAQRVQDRLLRILGDRKIYSWKEEAYRPAGDFGTTTDDEEEQTVTITPE